MLAKLCRLIARFYMWRASRQTDALRALELCEIAYDFDYSLHPDYEE